MADACILLLVSYNVNCKILLTIILCYSIAVKMDDKPVRVKQENCDNEREEVEILTRRDFGAEEATTTAAVGVKREGEGLIKTERQEFYEFGDGEEIIKDEDEEIERGTNDERRSIEREKKYPCDKCGKRFQTPSLLKRHERSHSGEKPFECTECGQRFSQKSTLTKHLRIHTGETPYQCRFCPKKFKTSFELRQHERIHSGEKPYSCSYCSKTFSQSSTLRLHEIIHNGEKNFECRECGKRFAHKISEKIH